ncbi:hypothetical protein PRVXT_000602 [Proteinivorax tanatarense]|uniref:ABC-2 type transport system permease protein n=1 Tax=Proteinivorax tanatarense TaxID=1260629 RepID=A0AAU7VND3_9FIRM
MIKTLFEKDIKLIKNRYFKTTKGLKSLIIGFVFISVVIALITIQFTNRLALLTTLVTSDYLIFLSLIFFSVVVFASVFIETRKKFYFSSELSLLIPTPIPSKSFFLYYFIKNACLMPHILVIGILLHILPMLISIGINAEASFLYYIAILPISYSILVIVASITISIMMFISSVFSVKTLNKFLISINVIIAIVFIGFLFFFRIPSMTMFFNSIDRIYGLLEVLFFPVKLATDIMYLLIDKNDLLIALKYLLYLLLIKIFIFRLSTFISSKLYYKGYDRVQSLNTKIKNKGKASKFNKKKFLNIKIFNYIVMTEWKKAYRNNEMINGSLSLIIILFIYIFLEDSFSNNLVWSNLQIIAHIGVIGFLCSGSVAMLFIPYNLILQGALKNQYWIFKVSPIKGYEYIFYTWLSQFVLQYIFSGIVLSIAFLIFNYNHFAILTSLIIMFVLIATFGIIKLTLNLFVFTQEHTPFTITQKIIINIMPFMYYFLALGILALSQIYSEISYLRFIANLNSNYIIAISGLLFLSISIFSIYYSFVYSVKFWEKMEF